VKRSAPIVSARPPFRVNPALLVCEWPRALGEYAAMTVARPLLRRAPRGDGHPVVVLPGFLAGDVSTRALRRFVRARGYHVHAWRQGINVGPTFRIRDGLRTRLAALRAAHHQPLTLIGWSLGGIYARAIAREYPDAVRQVITLGSPFLLAEPHEPPPEVPVTNVFSRTDGIAPWGSCIDEPGPRRENVEVVGSHCGLGHHPAALGVVADRLAQPVGAWTPFVPTGPLARLIRVA
jgi:pimeloyl-ACP methyl ester carboxylesterase